MAGRIRRTSCVEMEPVSEDPEAGPSAPPHASAEAGLDIDMETDDVEYVPPEHGDDEDGPVSALEDDEDDEEEVYSAFEEDASSDDDVALEEPSAADMSDGYTAAQEIETASDDDEDGQQGTSGVAARPVSIQEYLAWRLLGRMPQRDEEREDPRDRFPRLEDVVPQALRPGPLRQELNAATAAKPCKHRDWSLMDAGIDASLLASRAAPLGRKVKQAMREGTASAALPQPLHAAHTRCPGFGCGRSHAHSHNTRHIHSQQQQRDEREDPRQRQRHGAAASGAAAAVALPLVPPPEAVPEGFLSGLEVVPAPRLLVWRELGLATPGRSASGLTDGQRRHLCCYHSLPRHPRAVVDALDSRAYIGQFSADGNFFVAAFQDRRVRLYDVQRGWRLRKDITTRMCRWTITDTSISPDQRFVIYSSIMPIVHLVEVGSSYDDVQSVANITQVHEPLSFDDSLQGQEDRDFRLGRSFGIWSVQWSGDGREIVAGTNDQSVVVLDVETKRVVARVEGHRDDVNAVTYADDSPNIIVSGSDDASVKVWDRRIMMAGPGPAAAAGGGGGGRGRSAASSSAAAGAGSQHERPVGVLVGHTEGLTHLHARGDGRYLLSNCKDQSAKLWDLRMIEDGGSLRDPAAASKLSTKGIPQFNWDYRWQDYPAEGRAVRHPHDASLMTFRGHGVQHTLIRAYFSPAHTTGQRFVYTGSASGAVHVYDVVSGQEVEGSPFRLHRKLVRDVSWHPYEPVLATVSWDGTVVRWDAVPPGKGERAPEVPGMDAFNDYY